MKRPAVSSAHRIEKRNAGGAVGTPRPAPACLGARVVFRVSTSDNFTKLNKLHRNSADLVNPGK